MDWGSRMWIIVVIVVVVVVAAASGGAQYHQSGASNTPSQERGDDACEFCRRVENWWNSLSWLGKINGAVFYAGNMAVCKVRGC
jgi:hypothetical protein